jgi:hypothetical protein
MGGDMRRVGSASSLGSLGQMGTPHRMGILHGNGGGGGDAMMMGYPGGVRGGGGGVRVCRFFLQGNCVHGARCRHSHDPNAAAQVKA